MTGFLIHRIIQTIVVIFIVAFLAFSMIHITPGDAALVILGTEATQAQIDALRAELWLDRPFLVQYTHWLINAFKGDLGTSISYGIPVTELIKSRLATTGYLAGLALILSIVGGIIAGTICAIRRGGALDQIVSVLANLGFAAPVFWLGIISIYLFSMKLDLLPVQGWTSPFDDFWMSTRQAILPVFLLTVPSIAVLTRQSRSSILEVILQDYIRTAASKGLKESVIIFRHVLKNAFIPIVTLMGLQIRLLVGGSVLVETVFNVPGMGRLLVNAALNKDFMVIQGGVLVLALVVCIANLMVDLSYGWLDPRVKYE